MQAQIMYLKPCKSAILKNFHNFKVVNIFNCLGFDNNIHARCITGEITNG